MFKHLVVMFMTVLLSTSAFAQQKKKRAAPKKKPAATKTAPAAASTLPDEAPAEVEATPAPEAAPVAEPVDAAPAPTAVASGKISQFNWQPGDGMSGFEIGLDYAMSSYNSKVVATGADAGKVETTGFLVGLAYDYGFSATNSVGVSTRYSSLSVKQTPAGSSNSSTFKASGLGDIFINSKNFVPMGSSKLLYGVGLGFSPSKKKNATANEDGNMYSGGLSLPIHVGWEADMGGSYAGVRLNYGLMLERTTEGAGGVDTKTTGGNTLALLAYYESGVETYWNVFAGFSSTAEAESKTGSAAASKSKATSSIPFGFEWGTYMSPTMLLALHYNGDYISKLDLGLTENDAYLQHQIGGLVRFEF